MLIEGLLSRLRRDGVQIWLENGRLHYRAPKGVLTPERIAEIRARQDEIGAFLADARSLAGELSPIGVDRPAGALPLSFAQDRLWFLDQLGLADASYTIASTIRLQGTLDANALERAFAELVRRHESLRTRIATIDGRAVQVIDPPNDRALRVVDLSARAPEMQTAATERLTRDNTTQPFDLAGAPPFRASLVRLAPDHHLLLLAMHHIVSDAWSIELLIRDIAALYGAFRAGHPSPLNPLPVQYADYTLWQRQWLSGATLERALAYWTEQLSGAPEALDLPFDRPRKAAPSFAGAAHWFSIADDVASELRGLGQREGATLFIVLLAAFQLLLSRLCGQDDVVIGSPVAGRRRHEFQDLIGFFANILVLRSNCSGNPSFRDLLQRVKTTALDAYAHQDLPFEKLVETLQPERDLARHPLVQVMFAVQRSPFDALTLPDLTLTPIVGEVGTTKFDLTLQVYESASGLEASFEYATELFDRSTIERLAGCWLLLLKGIASNPDQRVAQLPLLNEAEQRRLLIDCNTTATSYPRDRCLYELFHEQAVRAPKAIAVEDGARRVSYGALDAWSDGIAAELHAVGVRAGTTVGLSGERSADLIAGMLGILKSGAIYVPLDPGYPWERLAFMVEDAGLDAVVVAPGGAAVAGLPTVRTEGSDSAHDAPSIVQGGAAVAYIMYTSGSTGVPKGIAVPHRAIARLVLRTDYIGIAPGDRLAQLASPSFDAATFELWGALLNGASLVIIDRDTVLSSQSFATALREKRITSAFVTTALFNRVARDVPGVFAPVRDLLFGGEAADPDAVRTVLAAGPPRRLIHVYGPTEATTFSTWLHVREVAADARAVPIGGPVANSTCHVLDRWLQPVPTGASGELYLGGDGLAHGYWDRPALTAERFIPDPFGAPGSRLYRSGDRVRRLPDGSIDYLSRLDGQVKIRGYRIELGEIEATLRSHAAVEQVAVVSRDDAGGRRLVAYVVHKCGPPPATGELQRHLKRRLPDYMVPAAFVSLDRLPLTPNGKLDRDALPPPSADAVSGQQVAPRTVVEEMLSALWCDVLQSARPGIDDNFFDCGGHSLIAAQLMARIVDAFSIELPLRTLFEAPTVRALALRVEETRRLGAGLAVPALTRRPRPSPLPLSYAQEPLWFLDQVGLVGPAYNMAGALRLDGCLDAAALAQSFGDVVRRHENLRTRFALVDGQGAQVIDDPAGDEEPAFHLDIVDLSTLPTEPREAEARRLAAEHAQDAFNLRSGSLLRAMLLRLDERAHLLLINMHHIIADGWSVRVLLKELGNRYAAHLAGHPSPLPELPVQYADYALWQREWLTGDILARHLDYWTSRLADAPAALTLPADRPRPPAQTFAGATLPFSLPRDLSMRLAALANGERATPPRDPLYGVSGGPVGFAVPSCRSGRHRHRLAGRRPVAPRARGADRDVRQHPGHAQRPQRQSDIPRTAQAHQGNHAWRLRASGSAVRKACRRPAARTRSFPSTAVSSLPGFREHRVRRADPARSLGHAPRGRAREPDGEIRSDAVRARDSLGPRGLDRICDGPVQPRHHRAVDSSLRASARGRSQRSRPSHPGGSVADRCGAFPPDRRMERDGKPLSARSLSARSVRRTGRAPPRRRGGCVQRPAAQLLQARKPCQPARPPSARARRWPRRGGRNLRRALPRYDRRAARHPQGRGRLSAARSDLSSGAACHHDGRCAGEARGDTGRARRPVAGGWVSAGAPRPRLAADRTRAGDGAR
jgi:amino acid adenylation domain-containing protein